MASQSYYRDRYSYESRENEYTSEFDNDDRQAYEESLHKFKDERDAIQKKTFTKWVNKHLSKCGKKVGDLFEDLRDGHNLVSLLEVLSGEHFPRERGRMRFHMIQNVQTVLDFLRYRKIKLVNIRAEDIVDGNPKLTLGLIWTIILHFQISDIVVGMEETVSAKDALLKWAQRSTAKYPGVRVDNFTSSWRDGLAFNAIIHRNRPDIIDWRKIQMRNPRDRLEHAFTTAERDCGVTRLLDPEDVDTPQPDEKSLITYISSLYDVFPEPPRLHPLYDTETHRVSEEYRDIASSLHTWMRKSTAVMQDRHFSHSIIEMRKMASEMKRFKVEELPQRNHDKQRLSHIFKDVEKSFRDGEIERELHIDNIERSWQILLNAHREKDQAIQDEIRELEKLQRIAEKIHREAKQVEMRLDDTEQKINEESRRIDRLHPLDAKNNCDRLEREMQITEESIKSMFSDAQMLREARFQQSSEIHKMVNHLHQRWISIRTQLHNKLLSVLASITIPIEEKSVTRTSKTVLETRLVETNQHFRYLQEVGDWIKQKQKQLADCDYGSDLPSIQAELDKQNREHKSIEKFQMSVDKCSSAKTSFSGDEQKLYSSYLSNVQKSYSDLLIMSKRRQSDLETLMDFVNSATKELEWLSQKEQIEITRDWSSRSLNLVEVEQYYESLMSELEKREIQFNAVQDRGESLVLQQHPASKCIETYMSAMQSQWSWILQLTLCLETHLKHVASYHQYFADIRECEQTIARKEEMLTSVFSKTDFNLDEGEMMLKEIQDMREELAKYGEVIQGLTNHSRDIIPLVQRKTNISHPINVTSICNYKQNNQQMVINKDERCTLLDNSQKIRWKVRNSSGLEGKVPGVCFLIPPPDKDALDAAERLKRLYDRVVTLWQKKHMKMRQNMIFATIKVVKSWNIAQFLDMSYEQRNAIRRAINEDAEKLIQEGDSNDPALRRLRREIDEVNRLFDQFEKKAVEAEKSKTTSKALVDQISTLYHELEDTERTIISRVNASIPRDLNSFERAMMEHRELDVRMHSYESTYESIQRSYSTVTQKSTSLQNKMDKLEEKWVKVSKISQLYYERMKSLEQVLSSMEETHNYVSQFETKLSSHDMSSTDQSALRKVSEDLYNMQNTVQVHQHVVDRMVEDTKTVRKVTEKSRSNQKRHPDVDNLEDDVKRTKVRWSDSCTQVVDRLRSVENASEMSSKYNQSYQKEMTWLDSMETRSKNLPLVDGTGSKRKINPHMTLYNSVIEEKITIEQVNTMGARLAKEAKKYETMVENYRQKISEYHLDSHLVKRMKTQSNEEVIYKELDLLNLKYQLLSDSLYQKIQQLILIISTEDPEFALSGNVRSPSPIKTYRSSVPAPQSEQDLYNVEDQVDSIQYKKSSANITLQLGAANNNANQPAVVLIKNGHTNGSDGLSDNTGNSPSEGTSLHFTQIRSNKRIHKVEEGISTETTIQSPAILDPMTGDSLTLAQAIGCGLIDLKTGRFIDPANNRRLTLDEAAEMGFIEPGLVHRLDGLCGLVDPYTGKELSLLEAIRKGYYDLSRYSFVHPETGQPLSPEEALHLGLFTKEKLTTTHGHGPKVSETEMMMEVDDASGILSYEQQASYVSQKERSLDTSNSDSNFGSGLEPALIESSNVINVPSTDMINSASSSISSVIVRCKNSHMMKALSDFIDQELTIVSERGVLLRNVYNGENIPLSSAVEMKIVSDCAAEIFDPVSGRRISIPQCLSSGLIDENTGMWNELESLAQARSSFHINKPLSLRDIVINKLCKYSEEEDGSTTLRISDPASSGKTVELSEAIDSGLLDTQEASVIDSANSKQLNLEQALLDEIVTSDGFVRDTSTNEYLTILEADQNGLLLSIQQHTAFTVPCIRDRQGGEYMSFLEANRRGVISKENEALIIENKVIMPFPECVRRSYIEPMVYDLILSKSTGLKNENQENMSVLQSMVKGKILNTGEIQVSRELGIQYLDSITEEQMSKEHLDVIRSLFDITMKMKTVRSVKKYTIYKQLESVEAKEKETDPGGIQLNEFQLRENLCQAETKGLSDIEHRSQDTISATTRNSKNAPLNDGKRLSQALDSTILRPSDEQLFQLPYSLQHIDVTTEAVSWVVPLEKNQDQIRRSKDIQEIKSITSEVTGYDNPQERNIQEVSSSNKDMAVQLKEIVSKVSTHLDPQDKSVHQALSSSKDHIGEVKKITSEVSGQLDIQNRNLSQPSLSNKNHFGEIKEMTLKDSSEVLPLEKSAYQVSSGIEGQLKEPSVEPEKSEQITAEIRDKQESKILDPKRVDETIMESSPENVATVQEPKSSNIQVISEEVIPLDSVVTTTTTTTTITHVILTKISRIRVLPTSLVDCAVVDRRTASVLSNPDILVGLQNEDITLQESVKLGKVDGNSGAIMDPQTQHLLTINEALVGEVLDQKGNVLLPVGRSLSVPELKVQGLYEPNEKRIIHPETGDLLTMTQAIQSDIVNPMSPVVNPSTKEPINLRDAIAKEIVADDTGDLKSQNVALLEGVNSGEYLDCKHPLDSCLQPVALTIKAGIVRGLVDLEKGTLKNPCTNEEMSIQEAYNEGKIMSLPPAGAETPITSVPLRRSSGQLPDDTLSSHTIKLSPPPRSRTHSPDQALENSATESPRKIFTFLPGDDEIKILEDTGTGKVTKPDGDPVMLKDLSDQGFLDSNTELIDQETGEVIKPSNLENIDVNNVLFQRPESKNPMKLKEYLKLGMFGVLGAAVAVKDHVTFKPGPSNVQEVEISSTKTVSSASPSLTQSKVSFPNLQSKKEPEVLVCEKPYPLPVAVAKGLYDKDTGLLKDEEGNVKTIDEAIEENIVDSKAYAIKDPRSNTVISLQKAIESGLVLPKTGLVVDPASNAELPLDEAMSRNLIPLPSQPAYLSDVILSDKYDSSRNIIVNENGTERSIEQAFNEGEISFEGVVLKDPSCGNKIVPFHKACEEGLVNLEKGTILPSKISLAEAYETGVLMETKKPMSLSEIMLKGLYDSNACKFIDPSTGQTITLKEAIDLNIVDDTSVHVKDTKEGFVKKMSLTGALEGGFISNETGLVKDFSTGEEVPICEALSSDLIVDSKRPMSLQKALLLGLYTDGKILDPNTGKKITLHESIRRLVIHPELPCYWDQFNEDKVLNLVETCRGGIIDRQTGEFKVPSSGIILTLMEALEQGYILNIEEPLSLYRAVKIGLYDRKGKFTHPSTGKQLNLQEAIKEELLNPQISIIKKMDSKILDLEEAILAQVIDPVASTYGDKVDLKDALKKGYILTNDRPLSLVDVVKEHLFDDAKNLIVDTNEKEWKTLDQSIQCGTIDLRTSVWKNLRTGTIKSLKSAIEDKEVDALTAGVSDGKNYKLNLKEAVELGAILKLMKPIDFARAVRENYVNLEMGTLEDPRTKFISSLSTAVLHELVDPESAVVKDPESSSYRNIREALKAGLIDFDRRALIDPQTKKLKQLCILFDQGTLVYVRNPVSFHSAREKGQLDLDKAEYIDPCDKKGQRMTLKEAVEIHAIDSHSACVKDTLRKQLIPLDNAFECSLMNSDTAMVQDTKKNHSLPLQTALNEGLLVESSTPFSLLNALEYSMYDSSTGLFKNPYASSKSKKCNMTLIESLENSLIEPNTTVVKDPETGKIVSLKEAIDCHMVDGNKGYFYDGEKESKINLLDAWKEGYLLAAEARLATEAQYKNCDATVTNLSDWLNEVEKKLASQEHLKETVEEIKRQTSTVKFIRDEVESKSETVASCMEQIRQLVNTGGDVLSSEEISALERNGKSMKSRYDKVSQHSETLYRKLTIASDELKKYKTEVVTFSSWMDKALRTLDDKERNISNVSSSAREQTKDFVSDVIAHQGDLRFITMSAQKFIDESKTFLSTLNEFRTSLPQRLPYLEAKESSVKQEVSHLTSVYQDLLARANKLFDRLSMLGNKQKDFQDALSKAINWLQKITPKVQKTMSEPISADPKTVESQINDAKTLQNEILSNSRLIESLRHASNSLLNSSDDLTPAERDQIERTTNDVENRYQDLLTSVSDRLKDLDSALVQSQGVQDAVDSVSNWLSHAENTLRNIFKPASLIRERLDEQIREVKMLQADIDSHRPSIENMALSADDLLRSGDARTSKKIEGKLKDVLARYDKLVAKLVQRAVFLNEVSTHLDSFTLNANQLEQWFSEMFDILETKLIGESAATRLEEIIRNKEAKQRDYEDTISSGKALVSKKDVTDTMHVKDMIKSLENKWKDLNGSIDDKQKQEKGKTDAFNAYDRLREQVLAWLTQMESRVERLEPVALSADVVKRQQDELKPILKEYRDYSSTIDKLNELGSVYDSISKGESYDGFRKRPLTSPSRKPSFRSDQRSPSPAKTFGQSPMSPGGSSGFVSRRTSQEGFVNIEDASPIQQQLNEINQRYNLIGMKLSDRQSEIDSLKEELRKLQENMKSVTLFLDKAERALPKDVVPQSKEESEKYLRSLRKIIEDMYDKQGTMDNLRSQVRDILKRKPNAPGAQQLEEDFEDLNNRWKSLQDTCKQRIDFLESAKDFYDTHDNLNNWLNAKDKMLAVLGPISTDPRMVNNQKDQVQVIRDEFRAQKPTLDLFNNYGSNILSQVPPDSSDGMKIEDKLANINQKWNDLLHKLDDREENLDAASGASKDFFTNLNKLQDNLHGISDDLDDFDPSKGDPESLLKQLENIERNLNDQRPLLADVEAAGEQLCDILQDPSAKSDIKQKLGQVNRLFNQCQKKLDNCKAEIENMKKDGAEFDEACESAQEWLKDLLSQFSDKLLVSADRDILKRQIEDFEPVYKDVMDKEHEIIMTLNKGAEIISRTTRRNDQRAMQQNMDKIRKSWDKAKKEAIERHTRLHSCNDLLKKYDMARSPFMQWLEKAENKLEDLKLRAFNKQELDKFMKQLQAFKQDISQHAGEYEMCRSYGSNFLSSCDVDKEGIMEELREMKERWNNLSKEIQARLQDAENAAAKLADFNDNCRDVKNGLNRCEDKLNSLDGDGLRDPRLLQKIKDLQDEASKLEGPLDHVKGLGEDLCTVAADQNCHDDDIRENVEDLFDKYGALKAKIDDRMDDLESAKEAAAQFNEQLRNISADIGSLEDDFNAFKPVGRDIPTVKSQIRELENFTDRLESRKRDVEEASRKLEEMIEQNIASDTRGMKDQVVQCQKQLQKLESKRDSRAKELDKTLERLEAFYDLYGVTDDDLNELIDQEKSMSRTVGGDIDSIKAQQAQYKEFRIKYVEPLGKKVTECNKSGQGLIQSAANGVNTTGLEQDLEKLNDKWNSLKEKINEQERKLDVAMLQSGKFKEAFEGLDKWLSEMEEMVANQKPPAADYKVVKAQLQEQQFLNKMLMDRRPSVDSLFKMGKEIAANADPADRAHIEDQMQSMGERYQNLCDGARDRQGILEEAMRIAKIFWDKLNPLESWLEKSERKLKDMSVIPTDEDKIQKRIREHDAFHDQILRKKADFTELADIAQNLMDLVGDDDASLLADKIQDVTEKYGKLVDDSENLGRLLKQSKAGVHDFVLSFEDLIRWMNDMDRKLQQYRIVSVHKDKLIEQMDQLASLTEEIKDHETQVDDTLEAGMNLMKNISNEEAIQLKDKLDVLQRRFHDLTVKASNYLKNVQDALPLVTQFHDNHVNLTEWMQDAEDTLRSLENASLSAQEKAISRLEAEIVDQRKLLDTINLVGPQLCQLSPGEGASTIEGLVTRDNRRFDAICEQVQRRAERIQMAKARSMEVLSDIDDLLDWFREIEGQIKDADKPSCEPEVVRVQLQEHRTLNNEIANQKARVREVLATAKKVLREATQGEDTALLREKAEDLKETMESVSKLSSDRLSALEQALPLAEHFFDTHFGLNRWMDVMEDEMMVLDTPAIRPDQIMKLQERTQAFNQSLIENRPLLDKLNKTGTALARLCNREDSSKVEHIMKVDNDRYNSLKAALRDKQQALEKALQETSQFKDKLDGMLNALENTADQVNNAEPIAAHPEKIQDQIDENVAIIDDVKKREDAFKAVKKAAADVIDKAANKNDPAVKDIKKKLDRLNSLWDQIQKATKQRGKNLDEALALAQKFWDQLQAVMEKLEELQETLKSQDPPAVEPKAIQQQQDILKDIKRDIEKTKPEVQSCRQSGQSLMKIVGDQEKPEIKKNIEDLDAAWDNITALFAKREENLIDAMEKAMEFHETLQSILKFLDKAEQKLTSFDNIGTDIDAVNKQIKELNDFKSDVDPMMVKVESLNRQAQELTERTSAEQAAKIKGPLSQVNKRWDNLLKGITERQRELENALLRLGQFQHALKELLAWIDKTNRSLDNLKPVFGDPQVIEVEISKLKVIINDIQSHQSSVNKLNDAGRQIIESEKGSENASKTSQKLNDLNKKWDNLQNKAFEKQKELEDALRDAQAFSAEIQDLLSWLNEVDGMLSTSKPVGGLPETAQEQLNRFMEIYKELEANRPKVETVLKQGQEYLKKSSEGSATNLQHNLRTLKQRWESVMNRANDKKIKLEIALKEALEFHNAVQEFMDWLAEAESYLGSMEPVSRVLEKVTEQISSHDEFKKQVTSHREVMLTLEKKGNHLKYFSQKQDVILIKNLLISMQHRWDRVVAKTTERTRSLDVGLKEATEFHNAWTNLCNWLDKAEKTLDEITASAANNPATIKQMLVKHKEFQKTLAAKQSVYDSTMRMGKSLKDKAPKFDEPILKQMLTDLKNKWNNVCNKSIERQRDLEDALLRSGQFKDALQELLDWLRNMDNLIVDDGPVHGDLDTVNALIEQHKKVEEELRNRESQMRDIIRTAQEMMETASADEKARLQSQINEIKSGFDRMKAKCERRSRRLEQALKEAEKLHKSVHMLLEWFTDAEIRLRFAASLPEDEESTRAMLAEQERFMQELRLRERDKDETLELARSILAKAHPDAVSIIKHWISVIQSRWDEISSWAHQRQKKLEAHLASLRGMEEALDELMQWLQRCEDTLTHLEAEPLPDDLSEIQVLIKEHKEFMESMAKRQVELDAICKPKFVTSRGVQPPAVKGRAGSRLRSMTPGTDSREGSPELDFSHRRISSPGRDKTPDLFPHIGPRFEGSRSRNLEPQNKSPRVKALWDKWKHVWMMAWERQRRLKDKYNYLLELDKVKNFSWDEWRKRFLKFMNNKKSRVTDLFRKIDKNNDNRIPREDFIDAIMKTKFPTSRLEMNAVADMFDHGDHMIDYMEFIAALRPDWEEKKPSSDSDIIDDEVQRQVAKCTCRQKFRVFQVGEGKYRFGDSQKLRLVRILRSTVMVRVGGGWVALDEFLVKNDPCRAKGRTNIELREQFILADGVSQTMTAFKSKPTTGGSSVSSGNKSSQSLPTAGPITKVKEKSIRSVPMGRARSTDRTTPDSTFSDDNFNTGRLPKRSSVTPGRMSQPGSRTGSKPPSRSGSNLSLDSTDEGSRIPVRRSTSLRRGGSGSMGSSSRSTPASSRPPFSLNTNVNGSNKSRGPSSERQLPVVRALSFTRPSNAQKMTRTGSASSITSCASTPGSRSKIPRFVGGKAGDSATSSPNRDDSYPQGGTGLSGVYVSSTPSSSLAGGQEGGSRYPRTTSMDYPGRKTSYGDY